MAWLAILGAGTAHRNVARGERAVFLLDEQFDIERDIAVLLGNLHQDRYRDLPAVVDRKPPRSSIRPRDRKSVGGLVLHESAQLLAYRGLDDRVEIENKKLTVFRDREETKFVRGPLGIRDLDGEAAVGRPGRALVDVVGSRTGRLPISAARAPENSTVGDPDQEVLDLIRVRIVRRRAARSTPGECEALGGRHRSFDDAGRTGPTAAGQAAVLVGLARTRLRSQGRSQPSREQSERR